tara:strand:- start:28 stop:207 length:180 start_codon:yes stop_codon:yes gene_type:complete
MLQLPDHRLTHLRELEAESIHIFREVVAEFSNPAMLYSVGATELIDVNDILIQGDVNNE